MCVLWYVHIGGTKGVLLKSIQMQRCIDKKKKKIKPH